LFTKGEEGKTGGSGQERGSKGKQGPPPNPKNVDRVREEGKENTQPSAKGKGGCGYDFRGGNKKRMVSVKRNGVFKKLQQEKEKET